MSQPLRRLAAAARPHTAVLLAGVAFLVATTLVETVVIPVLLTALLMAVIGPGALPASGVTSSWTGFDLAAWFSRWTASRDRAVLLWLFSAAGLVAMVTKSACTAARSILSHRFSFLVARDLRRRMFATLLDQSPDFYRRAQTGALVSRLTADIHLLHDNLGVPLFEFVQAPLGIALALAMMLAVSWPLTLTTLCVAPLVALFISRITHLVRQLTLSRQAEYARLAGYLAERLSAIRLIQAFGRQADEVRRLVEVDRSFFRHALRSVTLAEALGPATEVAVAAGMLTGLLVGGLAVIRGRMRPEHFILFFALAPSATTQLGRLARVGYTRQQLAAGATRVFEILDQRPTTGDRPGAIALQAPAGSVAFEHVTFSYDGGVSALSDVSLDVTPGTVLAIVGPSGAGKTTLVNLLPRFFDPTAGRVSIDGTDLRTVSLASLRSHIGLVAQDAMLFSDTVADNIRYGRPEATFEEVVAAARAANALEFIEQLPNGWHTVLAERGQSLSGGQRQRIAIARALLRAPRILILDEATSALDSTGEGLVQEALERLVAGRTTFVIAHRLSTVRRADRIVVMNGGRIVEQGTHDGLLARSGLYRQLHDAQFRDAAAPAQL